MQTFKESRLVFLTKKEEDEARMLANRQAAGLKRAGDPDLPYIGSTQHGVKTPSIFKGGPRITEPAPIDKTSAFDEGIEQATGEDITDETEPTRLTPEQEAALAAGQEVVAQTPTQRRESAQELGKELGLGTDIATTQADIAAKQLATQAAETQFSKEEERKIRELEDIGLSQQVSRIRRLGAAGRALLGGREGAVSGARRGLPSAIQAGGRIRLDLAQKQITASRDRRAELERRRKEAQQEDNNALATSLTREINSEKIKEANAVSKIQLEIEAAETAAAKVETEAQKEARAQLEVITDLPAQAFESLSAQDLGAQFEAAGLPFSLGGALKNAQMELAVAQKGKDETAILQAQATLAKTIAEVQQIGKPADSALQGKINTLNSLLGAGTITQDQFDSALSSELGIAEGEKFGFKEVGGKLYATDPKTGNASLVSTDSKGNAIAPQFSDVGNGNITQNYGAPSPSGDDDPLLQNGTFGTPGVDIDGITGNPIQAFVEGTVSSVGINGGYGNQVVITDNAGNQHMYSHLRELPEFLAVGQKVGGGDVVGYMGNTGTVFGMKGNRPAEGDTETGSHLDYRIKGSKSVNGSPWINPNNFLAEQPTKFKEELRPFYTKYNNGKMTKEDWERVSALGLDEDTFIKQSFNSKSTSDKDVGGLEYANEIKKMALELKESEGRKGLLFGLGKVPRTVSFDFKLKVKAFISKLSLDNLIAVKSRGATFGALSDTEMQILQSAATSLDTGMSEGAWDEELDKLIVVMDKAIAGNVQDEGDTGDSAETVVQNMNNDTFLNNFSLPNSGFFGSEQTEIAEETQPTKPNNT